MAFGDMFSRLEFTITARTFGIVLVFPLDESCTYSTVFRRRFGYPEVLLVWKLAQNLACGHPINGFLCGGGHMAMMSPPKLCDRLVDEVIEDVCFGADHFVRALP